MRYFMEISYLGTAYRGWQIQPGVVTVQSVIQDALSTLLRKPTDITGAGRTDAGVHARQMFAHFDTDVPVEDLMHLTYRLNSFLPGDISVSRIFPVIPGAHARFDAVRRTYEYHIYLGKNPFSLDLSWQIHSVVPDVQSMNKAAEILRGERDFKVFSKSGTDVKNFICNVESAAWVSEGKSLIFHITANRFLRNMVRAVVGTLWEVGTGKRTPESIPQLLLSGQRSDAGVSVPAKGLFLSKIEYDFDKLTL